MALEDPELEIGVRAMRDEEFREALLKEPELTLERQYGVKVPEGVRVHVHVETDRDIHLVVPGRPSWADDVPDNELDEVISQRMREGRTDCCTCGSSTAQSFSSLQGGCGC
jgi:Nitrile hydratase, alpha chain